MIKQLLLQMMIKDIKILILVEDHLVVAHLVADHLVEDHKEKNGAYPKRLTMALAYLIYFYKNDTPDDAADVMAKMKEGSIAEILADSSLWLTDISDMTDIVTEYYGKIETLGAKGAMEWILSE